MSIQASESEQAVARLSDQPAFNERMLERVDYHYGFMAVGMGADGHMVDVVTFIGNVPEHWLQGLQIHFRDETGRYLAHIAEIVKASDGFVVAIKEFVRYEYSEDVPSVEMGLTLSTYLRESRHIPMAEDSENPSRPHFLPS